MNNGEVSTYRFTRETDMKKTGQTPDQINYASRESKLKYKGIANSLIRGKSDIHDR